MCFASNRGGKSIIPDKPLIKKLLIKENMRVAVIGAPPQYQLGGLTSGDYVTAGPEAPLDFAQVFVRSIQEVNEQIPAVLKKVKIDGLLWVCYPKSGSKIKNDLNRDVLRREMEKYGMAGVSLVAIDNDWSAMRFRPADKVGK